MEMMLELLSFALFIAFWFLFLLLVQDIIMIKCMTGISWIESVRCGWLYWMDRFKRK